MYRRLPEKIKFSAKHKRLLRSLTIDESGPGTILHDFEAFLRFFAGRENKLPVDQPELIACIAPRPCLISTALNDAVESVWARVSICSGE
jgi:hypothetical protein